jgi:thiol:disulfide interchange protein DsbA
VNDNALKWIAGKRYILIIALALIAVGIEVYYSICGGACSYLSGSLFGIDLQYIGIAFMALIILLSIIKKALFLVIALSAGVGVEVYLVGFQIWYDTYCPYCLIFGGIVMIMFLLNIRKAFLRTAAISAALTLILFSIFFKGSATPVYAAEILVPSFGTGAAKVRIYTDYFCSPCRDMEPKVEPILEELVKKNAINLTFIDTPIYKYSALYARYFLYIMNEKKDFDHALLARSVLIGAVLEKITDQAKLEEYLNNKMIKFKPFETKPTFDLLNNYLKNDKINATPTCVIEKDGKTEKVMGGPEIIAALERLKQEFVKKTK